MRPAASYSSVRKRKSYSAEPSVGAGRPPDLCDSYNRRRLIRAGGLTAESLATERGTAALRSRCPTLCLRTAGVLDRRDAGRAGCCYRQKEASGSRPATGPVISETGTAPGQNADCRRHERAVTSSAEMPSSWLPLWAASQLKQQRRPRGCSGDQAEAARTALHANPLARIGRCQQRGVCSRCLCRAPRSERDRLRRPLLLRPER